MIGGGVRRLAQALALALVLSLFGLLVWRLADSGEAGIRDEVAAGKRPLAPDFTLPRLDGDGVMRLSSLRGKVVVLNVWASWCFPCKQEAPVLEQTWKEHGPERLVVVGADWKDLRGEARRFARQYRMSYPLVDDGERLTRPYGLTGVPETFVIDRRGRILGSITGGLNARKEWRQRYDELVRQALRT